MKKGQTAKKTVATSAKRQAKYRESQLQKGRISDTYFIKKKTRDFIRKEARKSKITTGEVVEKACLCLRVNLVKDATASPVVISDGQIQIRDPKTDRWKIIDINSGKLIKSKKSPGPYLKPAKIPMIDIENL